jgi:hypothetical protein
MLPVPLHPESEPSGSPLAAQAMSGPPVPVDTLGRRFHVEWDPHAPVTPLGQLVFFAQFLAAGGLYADWVSRCPLRYASPNAPKVADVLGTWVLATLGGAWRYAHVSALRGDSVKPPGLGSHDRTPFPGERIGEADGLKRREPATISRRPSSNRTGGSPASGALRTIQHKALTSRFPGRLTRHPRGSLQDRARRSLTDWEALFGGFYWHNGAT